MLIRQCEVLVHKQSRFQQLCTYGMVVNFQAEQSAQKQQLALALENDERGAQLS